MRRGAIAMAMPAERTRAQGRWLALDLLRFCAVFLMIQGHTFTALLEPAVRAERWYRHHNFVHGYTAPMFLFASGLAFGYTTFRSWNHLLAPGPALWKRFRRYGWLLLIGYGLHLPSTSLVELSSLPPERLRTWLQIDVLQHIALNLALCQLLVLVLRTPRRFAFVIAGLFALAVLSAPIVWSFELTGIPIGVAGIIHGNSGSPFPLVPWAGFTYAGILCAYFARNAQRPSRELAWPFAITAALLLLVPIAINHAGFNPYGVHEFWKTSPYYFFWRLGNVVAVLALLCFAERFMERIEVGADAGSLSARALALVRVVGQESLIVYVGHLLVLHGSVINRGIRAYTGETLSLWAASAVALLLFVAMIAFARVWHEQKTREVRPRSVQFATTSMS